MNNYKSMLASFIMGAALGVIFISPSFAMLADRPEEAAAATRAPSVMRGIPTWGQANTEQKELLFQVFTRIKHIRENFDELVDVCQRLVQQDEPSFQEDVQICGKADIINAIANMNDNITSFPHTLAYYEAHSVSIDLGVVRAHHIRRQLLTIHEELRTIFRPLLGISVDAMLGSKATAQDFLDTQIPLVAHRFKERALFRKTSEGWRTFLYPECNTDSEVTLKNLSSAEITALQAMEDARSDAQAHETEDLARQAAKKIRLAEELTARAKEEERARHRLRLQEFNDSPHGVFFHDLEAHYLEKMAHQGGHDEGVMRFYGRDSLDRLLILLSRDKILDQLTTLHGLTARISEPHKLLTMQSVDEWLGLTVDDRAMKNAFHGGLRTIWKHATPDGEFPMMPPKDAFLNLLGLLHQIHQAFPTDERVNQTVLQAYFWIVDQDGACPADLLGRSFMLGEVVSKLLVGGLEHPFVR